MGPVRVISLASNAQRREEFRRRNAHLDFVFHDAVDGRSLTPEQIEATGLFDRRVWTDYGAHGFGVALSHHGLWLEAVAGAAPLTIAEDDAVFRHDFESRARETLATLPPDWDIVLWGFNFDSILHVAPMGGVSPVVLVFDQNKMRQSLAEFQALASPVQAWPVERAFGLLAYTLSPLGAAKFLKLCFPQQPSLLYLPIFNHFMRNMGVDAAMNHVYAQTASYACFPPLAVSPNVRGS